MTESNLPPNSAGQANSGKVPGADTPNMTPANSSRGLFRKVAIVLVILAIPLVLYLAMHYGEVQSVSFARSLEIAKGRTEIEPRYKLVIESIIFIDAQHPFEGGDGNASFYARDRDGEVFFVSYDGGEKVDVQNGMQVKLAGHTHEGTPPWFHCSEVITDY